MKNNWKLAFWIQFIILIFTILFFLYINLDQGVTIAYMKEGYKDTELDLMQVSSAIKGKLGRQDFKNVIDGLPNYQGDDMELKRLKIGFGADGKVDSITTKW